MTCDRCLRVAGPHGVGICPLERRGSAPLVVGDDIPGGQVFENGFSTPTKFYSHSAHRNALDRAGFQIAPRYVEGSKHLTKWSTVDLKAATALVSRGVVTREQNKRLLEPHPDHPITVTDAGWKAGR